MGLVSKAEPDTDALDDLEMVRAMSSRQKPQNAVLAPSVVSLGHQQKHGGVVDFFEAKLFCNFLLVLLFCN